jgi:hypothetical protein
MKNNITLIISLFICVGFSLTASAQDLLNKLDKEFPDKPVYEIATFKTTRIGLGHSVETRKKGILEISMYNRYWNLPTETSERFLADKVSTRFGLDYALTDNFTFGLGYTNFDKITEGFLKYKLIKQRSDSKKAPVSVTLFQGISHRNTEEIGGSIYEPTTSNSDNYAFTSQVLIAKKFNSKFSVQVAPTFIYRSKESFVDERNSQFALGVGARHKFNAHTSIVTEYYYVVNPLKSTKTFAPFMVGVNWELSHLMLQFHVTNARNYAEDTFITQTTHNFNFKDPNLHFGFNATFVLDLMKNKLK